MTDQENVPFVAQDIQEAAAFLNELESHAKKWIGVSRSKKTFSCKKTAFQVQNSPDNLAVDSWRFQEWDYKRDDLPTYARGLFTYHTKDNRPEIAIRGYDKFFNTDEVEATKWSNIEQYTKGPYELSLKENGCIIFISGLSDDSLLVCSKHSTGPREDSNLSHAIAGERWVDRQLKAIGKTRQDLSRELRKRNATAVAELCDDDFEEHILAYRGEAAGLYLHGININVPEFTTYSGPQVQQFANEWGFKRTDFLVLDDITTVRTFLESVAETGSYNGRDVEGFVIRCKSKFRSKEYQDWFFKYKFEEPYLMFRQWRECTKMMINGKPPLFKKHVKITEEYLLFARKKLAENPKLAREYNGNHGIIELRDDFLKEKNLKGSDLLRLEYSNEGEAPQDATRNIILVPVATIGCGKTTISIALQHLFGWGHVQNDNIQGKGRPPRFTKEVMSQLEDKPVVIADRNNAQRHERKQLIGDVHHQYVSSARLVALNFVHDRNSIEKIRQVTQDRVFARGDNHQTIQAATDKSKVMGIMQGFINRFEPLRADQDPDHGFDAVIDLDPTSDSRQNLETVIGRLSDLYPKLLTSMPTSEDLDDAIAFALNEYRPELKHDVSGRGPKVKSNQAKQKPNVPAVPAAPKKKALEYISIDIPTKQIQDALEKTFSAQDGARSAFFRQLQETRRVQPKFHVTLIHRASARQHPEIWERYKALYEVHGDETKPLGDCQVQLERVVWSHRIMAIVVRLVSEGWDCANPVPHITVGTRADDVKPKESNDLLQQWLQTGSGEETGIYETVVQGVTVEGTVHAVLQRH
ncbi:hypothetical protein V494_05053 [Pseudogymnoascus sp. VKM F-4513 (FW-928)]|nr:hypothetical protein V494_05053 [Pseudogymnoascus sp. VKM F-4513 (FW-928)]